MNQTDSQRLSEILDGLAEYYRVEPPSQMAMKIYASALKDYSIDDIAQAAMAHTQTPSKHGRFFPKASDLIEIITGGEPLTAQDLLADVRNPTMPVSIFARAHGYVTTFDLNNQDDFYLLARCREAMAKFPEWAARARKGEYTKHELTIMAKYSVSSESPFANGLPKPNREALTKIAQKRTKTGVESTKNKNLSLPTG